MAAKQRIVLGLSGVVLIAGVIGIASLLSGDASKTAAAGAMSDLTSSTIGTAVGERAPQFQLTGIDGRAVAYDSGKAKVIFFMASWCVTCIPEERALAQLYHEFGDQVDILTIDVDERNDTVDDLRNFQSRYGGDWYHILDQRLAYHFQIRSLDTTFVLNRHGVITYSDAHPTAFATLEREILKVLSPGEL